MVAEGVSFKQALNDAIRAGPDEEPTVSVSHTRARSLGMPRIDLTKALQLAGQLEDQEKLDRMKSPR
ncbi:MAG: antitoxin [Actinomycetota bacterium]|nr:antitoxin [Actinomycetota bacterium]